MGARGERVRTGAWGCKRGGKQGWGCKNCTLTEHISPRGPLVGVGGMGREQASSLPVGQAEPRGWGHGDRAQLRLWHRFCLRGAERGPGGLG